MLNVRREWMAQKTPSAMDKSLDTTGLLEIFSRGPVLDKSVRPITTVRTKTLSLSYALEGNALAHHTLLSKGGDIACLDI